MYTQITHKLSIINHNYYYIIYYPVIHDIPYAILVFGTPVKKTTAEALQNRSPRYPRSGTSPSGQWPHQLVHALAYLRLRDVMS